MSDPIVTCDLCGETGHPAAHCLEHAGHPDYEEPRDTIETPEPVCRSCGAPVLIDENEDVEASEFICEGCADDEGDPS